jgi:hypothetical protein
MMPKFIRPEDYESRLGRGDDIWEDLSKKKKLVWDEEIGEQVEEKPVQSVALPVESPVKHESSQLSIQSSIPVKHELTVEEKRRGGLKGGSTRALLLSKQERIDIARQGAQARWVKKGKGEQNT